MHRLRALLLACLLGFCASGFANDGQLILVSGDVTLQRVVAGQATRSLVPVTGARVQSGDSLITGATGRVQIRFSDGSLLSLQPQSEFRIDEYRFDTSEQRGFYSLVRGALRTISGAIGKRDPDDYRMTTPTATIGIRGTEFVVEETVCTPACHPGRTAGLRVAVSVGRVAVSNAAGSIEVAAGNATYVAGPANAPVPTSERPTLSTAPASFDPTDPAGTVRVARRETAGNGTAIALRTAQPAVESRAGRESRNQSRNQSRTEAPAGSLVESLAAASGSDGMPPALLDLWRAEPVPAGVGPIATGPQSLALAVPAVGAAVTVPAGPNRTTPPKSSRVTVQDSAPDAAPGSRGESGETDEDKAGTEEADPEEADAENALDQFAEALPAGTTTSSTADIDFNRPTATGGESVPSGNADPVTDDPITATALSPSGDGMLTAPVNGSTGSNSQLDPSTGMPIALGPGGACPSGQCGAGGAGGGNAGNGGPGSSGGSSDDPGDGVPGDGVPGDGVPGGGDPGNGDPGNGDPGNGDPGSGDPGSGGPPVLTPGLNEASRVAVRTLQSPWFDLNLNAANANVNLDSEYRLESIGICPSFFCLSRNTAQVVESGHFSDVAWGRWINGTARLTVLGLQTNHALGSNDGVHYLVGVPTVTMPTSGSATYSIAGATSPTFASGAVAPGVFTGQGLVQFGAGLETRVGFKGDLMFGSGEHYQLSSNGARTDSAGRLVEIGDTQIRMTGRTTFSGNLGVTSQGSADRLGCGGSNCQANVSGGFYGPEAARMGVGYSVGRTQGGGDTINGVAVFNRE